MRVGFGYDSHRLVAGRRLVLGGVAVGFPRGLAGHSDADVLTHAIIDALVGALGLGDIGALFPDTDPRWKDAVSTELLSSVVDMAAMNDYTVAWVDCTVIAELPKLAPYMEEMKESLSRCGIGSGRINIKAKTNEGMGPIGRGEGIAAYAVCLLLKDPERMA
jgi:2-C-methyl-D-erythritol 2,4-cyclodiphosphate synthase